MPNFLEEFASSVNDKRNQLKEKIFTGKPNPLQDSFKKYFDSFWIPLEKIKEYCLLPHELNITAIDSSVYTNLLSTGGVFNIIRSLAVCKDRVHKKLETDVFFTREGLNQVQYFITRKMELLEFEVAVDALKNGFRGDAILLDGSLYGRALAIPIEKSIEEERITLLRYFQVYKELLDLCRNEEILLIGVSKESRSTFYRDYLLSLMFNERLKESDIEANDLRILKDIFPEILDNEEAAFSKFQKLKDKQGLKLEKIEIILNELASSRPDYQLVMNFAQGTGFTQPMLLGPSARVGRRFKQYRLDPKSYVRKNFPVSRRERGSEFVEWAANIVSDVLKFPSFISFYVLLDRRDSPIRIDMPDWNHLLSEAGWPKPVNVDLTALLKIIITGYCGLDGYNLWLKNVDQRVRLKRKVVDKIYFPFMEKLFQDKIIRGRGYRRVKYP